jgi:phosphoribosylglycinamide formyltransferase-1
LVYKIGWFSTGRDKAARELLNIILDNIQNGTLNAEIEIVFSDREFGEFEESNKFFDLVKSFGLELVNFSSRKYQPDLRSQGKNDLRSLEQWRLEFDRQVMKLLSPYSPDLIILAGYMLIVGPELCTSIDMVNLHPAKPGGPKGTWQEVIWELIRNQEQETGIMMHLVTPILDEGPPVTFCTFPIRGGDFEPLWEELKGKLSSRSLEDIIRDEGENEPYFAKVREEGVMRELPMILYTIREFAEGNVKIEDRKIRTADGSILKEGYDLTQILNEVI